MSGKKATRATAKRVTAKRTSKQEDISDVSSSDMSSDSNRKNANGNLPDSFKTEGKSEEDDNGASAGSEFNLDKYFEDMKINIRDIVTRERNNQVTYDILDTEKSVRLKLVALYEKQRVMQVGEIWQVAVGNYKDCINLKQGSESGLDVISHPRKFAIEIKNRTNTDNASSRKSNFGKLAAFKKKNNDYECIYACINDATMVKTTLGKIETIKHEGVEIKRYVE